MDRPRFPDPTDRLEIAASAYVSPHAVVCGTVSIGADSSVWPLTVIRGDKGVISIGARTNIQDGCILHADPDAYLTIGDEVSLGLAPIVVRDVYAALPEIRRAGATLVIVEQDIARALAAADRVYCVREGRSTLAGKPADLSREAIHAAYFGG